MALADRFARLEPREKQLLTILGSVFAVFLLLLVPLGVSALLASERSDVEALRDAIEQIQSARDELKKRELERGKVIERYSKPAPPLAGALAGWATASQIEIPESQDRALVPHGKRYDERSTKIVLRKVGMLSLVTFMEKLETSGHPVTISRLNIRKRGTEPDSYDVEMIVSAFDRKPDTKKEKTKESAEESGETEEAP
jgi:general secretion pathway protein M